MVLLLVASSDHQRPITLHWFGGIRLGKHPHTLNRCHILLCPLSHCTKDERGVETGTKSLIRPFSSSFSSPASVASSFNPPQNNVPSLLQVHPTDAESFLLRLLLTSTLPPVPSCSAVAAELSLPGSFAF